MAGKIWAILGVLAVAAVTVPCTADPAPNDKAQQAYDIAIKCFIADSFAAGRRERAQDAAGMQYYDKKADDASAAGQKLTGVLGYPLRQFLDDATAIQDGEFTHYFRDPGYFSQVAATCKAYGLM